MVKFVKYQTTQNVSALLRVMAYIWIDNPLNPGYCKEGS